MLLTPRFRRGLLPLSLAAVACGGDARPHRFTVRDSAGVRIVDNTAPAWSPETAWRVADAPSLSIGGQEGEAAYLFHGVVGARRLSDGRIAVADYSSHQIRVFDAAGRHLASVGGQGDGPGEFRFMSLFWSLPGDTLVISDIRGLSLFDAAGTFVRRTALASVPGGSPAQALGQLRDGTIIAMRGAPIRAAGASGRVDEMLEVHAFRPDGSWIALVDSVPAAPLWRNSDAPTIRRMPFYSYPARGMGTTHVYLLHGEPQIDVFRADGTFENSFRWTPPSRELTGENIERYRTHVLAPASNPESRRNLEQFLDEVPMPERIPAVGESTALLDENGYLWVEAYHFPWVDTAEWIVFSPEGEWLGSVSLPPNFTLHDVGRDWVLGVARDELGVERVRMLPLIAPGRT